MSDNSGRHPIGDRYLLLEALGSGGMGTVWRAEDQLLERRVAVKEVELRSSGEDLAKRMRRAVREARTVARVSHPNVVDVYDLVHEDERLWIVMELVHGQSLSQHLAMTGTFSVSRTADIGVQLLDALKAVHAEGALHRDVKPANVLLRADGHAVLCDFGIANVTGGEQLTSANALVGSADAMAPERLLNQQVGPPSDLFSLGLTLCRLVTGCFPFHGHEPAAVMHAVAYEAPDIPDTAGPLYPLIEALLRKNAAERPTVEEAADALRPMSGMEPTGAWPGVPGHNSQDPGGTSISRRWLLWTAPLAAVALAGGGYTAADLAGFGIHSGTSDGGAVDGAAAPRPLPIADAMLQTPKNETNYWMFRGNRCTLIEVTDHGGKPRVVEKSGTAMPLHKWAPDLPAPFRDKVDAVMPTPDRANEYWLFSDNQYLRVQLTGRTRHPQVKPVFSPASLSDWEPAFDSPPFDDGIDAVMHAWSKPNEYRVFSGNQWVSLRLKNGDEEYAVDSATESHPLKEWKQVYPGNRVDAVMPTPKSSRDYWVLSGHHYSRVRIDEKFGARQVGATHRLGDWRP